MTLLLRVRGNTETERWALERRRAFDATVAALVREAVERGSCAPDVDPALAARLLSGLVNSMVEWYRPGRPGAAGAARGGGARRLRGHPAARPPEAGSPSRSALAPRARVRHHEPNEHSVFEEEVRP